MSYKAGEYRLNIVGGSKIWDPDNDNIDVEVIMIDGQRFCATFFTIKNINKLIQNYKKTGECKNGLYFWASDAILVEQITEDVIRESVDDLINNGEFERAFSLSCE